MEAFGMIETLGLIASIEAADSMLKSANVKLYSKEKIGAGRVSILVVGDVGAVKAAVDAGVSAVLKIGSNCLLSSHVIPRPSTEIFKYFGKLEEKTVVEEKKVKLEPKKEEVKPKEKIVPKKEPESEIKQTEKKEDLIPKEALNLEINQAVKKDDIIKTQIMLSEEDKPKEDKLNIKADIPNKNQIEEKKENEIKKEKKKRNKK